MLIIGLILGGIVLIILIGKIVDNIVVNIVNQVIAINTSQHKTVISEIETLKDRTLDVEQFLLLNGIDKIEDKIKESLLEATDKIEDKIKESLLEATDKIEDSINNLSSDLSSIKSDVDSIERKISHIYYYKEDREDEWKALGLKP